MISFTFNKNLLQLKVMYFFGYAGMSPLTTFGPTVAKQLRFSASAVGFAYFTSIVLSIFGRLIFGYLADKLRIHKALLILSTLLCSLAILSIALFPQQTTDGQDVFEKAYVIHENNTSFEICFVNDRWSSLKENLNGKVCRMNFQNINLTISFATNQSSNASVSFDSVREKSENGTFSCLDAFKTGIFLVLDANGMEEGKYCDLSRCSYPNDADDEKQKSLEKDMLLPLFWLYLGVYAMYFVMSFIMGVFMDTICFHTLDNEEGSFGNQRMFASLGWGMAALFSGVLTDYVSENLEFKNYLPTFMVSFLFLITSIIVTIFFKMPKISQAAKTDWDVVYGLLWHKKSFVFACWCFVIGVCSAIVWQYSFWVVEEIATKHEQTWVKSLQGAMVVMNTFLGDVPTYYFFDRILSKVGYINCMTLTLLLQAIRLFAYSILSHPIWALFIAVLDGISFGMGYATITSFANLISTPETKTIVQATFNSIFDGLGTSLGALCFGFVYDRYGHSETFRIGSFMAIGCTCLHILSRLRFNKPKI
ncbi:major facilitator superfamily domain-containing protein 6-A-like [Planococcus citri]|uniref:major facilitator superfamily domain-containing protein 6-A-like n=1 Tax=Planococcus citri TaxID=170843 RepID=UPI0031F77F08